MVCVQPNDGKSIVAITGASGFIGSWVVKKMLDAGYHVRAVVRNTEDDAKTAHLKKMAEGGSEDRLTFFSGDLFKEGSFDEAFFGADAVVHCAAVVALSGEKDPEKTVVRPSVVGTQNVLNSLTKDGAKSVKRLVVTSSIASIMDFNAEDNTTFTEEDYNTTSTVENGDAYGFAKSTAEKMVWDQSKDKPYDVTCINPTITLGPVFTKVHTKASVSIIRQFMNGKTVFNVTTGYVDVEDVADGHVQALMREEAGGQRYIVNGVPDSLYMPRLGEIAQNLYPKYKIDASPFPPNWVLAAAKMGNMLPAFRRLAITDYEFNSLTKTFMFDNSKSISELGLKYHRLNETLQRSVDSMIQVGINPRLADNPHPKTSI